MSEGSFNAYIQPSPAKKNDGRTNSKAPAKMYVDRGRSNSSALTRNSHLLAHTAVVVVGTLPLTESSYPSSILLSTPTLEVYIHRDSQLFTGRSIASLWPNQEPPNRR